MLRRKSLLDEYLFIDHAGDLSDAEKRLITVLSKLAEAPNDEPRRGEPSTHQEQQSRWQILRIERYLPS